MCPVHATRTLVAFITASGRNLQVESKHGSHEPDATATELETAALLHNQIPVLARKTTELKFSNLILLVHRNLLARSHAPTITNWQHQLARWMMIDEYNQSVQKHSFSYHAMKMDAHCIVRKICVFTKHLIWTWRSILKQAEQQTNPYNVADKWEAVYWRNLSCFVGTKGRICQLSKEHERAFTKHRASKRPDSRTYCETSAASLEGWWSCTMRGRAAPFMFISPLSPPLLHCSLCSIIRTTDRAYKSTVQESGHREKAVVCTGTLYRTNDRWYWIRTKNCAEKPFRWQDMFLTLG